MNREVKTVVYDSELHIEAYRFEGVAQPFPNHFHEYYVIGFMEGGRRRLSCRNREYTIAKGDIVIFNPGDNHACVQTDGGALDYCGLNITREIMLELAAEVTGRRALPGFTRTVVRDEDVTGCLRPLHELIMNSSLEFDREERLLLLISLLIQRYGQPFEECVPECREEIESLRVYGGALHRAHLPRADLPPGRAEQIHSPASFYCGKGYYAVLLSGEHSHRKGQKAVGAGSYAR